MVLDVQDTQYKASIKPIADQRFRLVLEFPAERAKWVEIYNALGCILKPRDAAHSGSSEQEDSKS